MKYAPPMNTSRFFCVLLSPIFALFSASCGTSQLASNHDQMRVLLMKYEEDQIMDNLIRAQRKLPIMHFDYDTVSSNVVTTLAGELGGGRTSTRVNEGGASGVLSKVTGTITRPFAYALKPTQASTVQISVTPVLDKNQVYEAYEAFLEKHPLVVAKADPGTEHSHIGRWCGPDYYYVPSEDQARIEFFNLCLVTTVKRDLAPQVAREESVSKKEAKIQALQSAATSPEGPSEDKGLKGVERELRKQNTAPLLPGG